MEPEYRTENEREVLAACYLRPIRVGEAMGKLQPDDFLHPAHRAIWKAMIELWLREEPLDPRIIAERVSAHGSGELLAALGGADYIAMLPEVCVVPETFDYHVAKVRRYAQRYRWGQCLARLAARAARADESDEEYLEAVGTEVLAVMTAEGDREPDARQKSRKEVLREVIAAIEEAHQNKHKAFIGVPSGIHELDRASRGLRAGQLIILAARPGVGKSALMIHIIESAAAAGVACLVFSLEMTAAELGKRAIAARAAVDAQRISHGNLESFHWVAINRAASELSTHNVTTIDIGSVNTAALRSIAKRWRIANAGKQGLIAIDYLQLVRSLERNAKREQQVAEVSRLLKEIAKDLEVPVLALAQLNRQVESRADKRPGLSDLRESGQIEQDADVVMFIHREGVFDPTKDASKTEIIIAKNRSGPSFTTEMRWRPEYTRFENPSNRE